MSEDILRLIPPSQVWGALSMRQSSEWRAAAKCGVTSTSDAVVVTSNAPSGGSKCRESHSWPCSSAFTSVQLLSCAMLDQYRTIPSGDTAKQQGIYKSWQINVESKLLILNIQIVSLMITINLSIYQRMNSTGFLKPWQFEKL